jgi:hypothetical protein
MIIAAFEAKKKRVAQASCLSDSNKGPMACMRPESMKVRLKCTYRSSVDGRRRQKTWSVMKVLKLVKGQRMF